MRTSLHLGWALVAGLAPIFVAGCSGGTVLKSTVLPETDSSAGATQVDRVSRTLPWVAALPEAISRSTAAFVPAMNRTIGFNALPASVLYVCGVSANVCNIYKRPGYKLVGKLKKGIDQPQGVVTGLDGQVYVANTGAGNVQVFAKGGTSPIETLSDPGSTPDDVAVARGEVVVSNFSAQSGSGNVAVYKNGQTSPSYTLSDPSALQGIGIAVDAHGNCFWSNNSSTGGQIDEFKGCSQNARAIHLHQRPGFAGGLAFDGKSNLWYTDQNAGLFRCVGLTSCGLIVPSSTNCEPGVTVCDPLMINFDRQFGTLFMVDTQYGVYSVTALADISPDYVVTPILAMSGMPVGNAVNPGPTPPPTL